MYEQIIIYHVHVYDFWVFQNRTKRGELSSFSGLYWQGVSYPVSQDYTGREWVIQFLGVILAGGELSSSSELYWNIPCFKICRKFSEIILTIWNWNCEDVGWWVVHKKYGKNIYRTKRVHLTLSKKNHNSKYPEI